RPTEELLGVEVEVDDREAVQAPLPRVPSAGEDAAGIADPEAAEPDARFRVQAEEPPEGPGAGHDVDGRRVPADRPRLGPPSATGGGRGGGVAGAGSCRAGVAGRSVGGVRGNPASAIEGGGRAWILGPADPLRLAPGRAPPQ